MSNYTVDNDVVIDIYRSNLRALSTGFDSIYSSIAHPGSNKKIQGWQWDRRTWPDQKELEALQYSPSIWDPVSNFLDDDYWQSGIGDNKDLLLFNILEFYYNNLRKWIPKINHGYFYEYDNEYYLFSDDYLVENFYNSQTYSGLQYSNLSHRPKVGVPVKVRRYKYDKANQRYNIDLDFRKRASFTGRLDENNVELDTLNDENNISFENVHSGNPEFIIDYNNQKVWLNDDYSESIADSGDFQNYELLGVGDGYKNNFFTKYSPIDPSGAFEVITYISSGLYTTWTQIDNLSDFTESGSYEYKLDPMLGIVSFGNYGGITGSGLIPVLGNKIAARYSKGIALEYEPQYSRDYVLGLGADTNPFHTSFEKGFLSVGLDNEVPASVTLSCNLSQNSSNQYQVNVNGLVGKITATVKSNKNNLLPRQTVYFENIEPATSSVSPLSTLTNIDGEAYSYVSSPSDISDIGYLTTDITHSGSNSIINVPGLRELTNESGVLLFGIAREDLVLATPSSGENNYYFDFLNGNGIYVNPSATDAQTQDGIDFEKLYRQQFGLTNVEFIDDTDTDNLSVGRREVIYINNPNHIHPHSGAQYNPTYSPIFPIKYVSVGTSSFPEMELVYDELIEPLNDEYKSFLVAAEALDYIRAYVVNPLTGQRIYSNVLEINVGFDDSFDGVINCEDSNDVPSGLFRETRNINHYTDNWIIDTTSGYLFNTYLEQRLASGEFGYKPLEVEDKTIALYHFESSGDSSLYSYSLESEGSLFLMEKAGYSNKAGYIANSGEQVWVDDEFLNIFDIHSGTLEFAYRSPYSDYIIESGRNYFQSLVGVNNSGENQGIETFSYLDESGDIRIGFDYISNGESLFDTLPSAYSASGVYKINDGYWHQIKYTWLYDLENNLLDINGYIDNQHKLNASNISTVKPVPGGLNESTFVDVNDYSDFPDSEVTSYYLYGVAYGNNRFVTAGSTNGGTRIAGISFDGLHWSRVILPGFHTVRSTRFINNIFMTTGTGIKVSEDGVSWEERDDAEFDDLWDVIYNGSSYILFNQDVFTLEGTQILSSTNAVSWTEISTIPNRYVEKAIYQDNKIVAIAGNHVLVSVDNGVTWSEGLVDTSFPALKDITYGDGLFVITGGIASIFISSDGFSWTEIETGFKSSVGYIAVTYYNNKFVAINKVWDIDTSTNGLIWTRVRNGVLFYSSGGGGGVSGNGRSVFVANTSAGSWPIIATISVYSNIIGKSGYKTLPGYYDEFRVTSGENNTDFTFQPKYYLEYESYVDWFRRTRLLDSKHLGLNTFLYSGTCPSTVPVGFRLKSSDTDVASVIGYRTFLDLNDPLPNDYYLVSGLDIYEKFY